MSLFFRKAALPTAETALRGRERPTPVTDIHTVLGTRLDEPFPENLQTAVFGMGCFWGIGESKACSTPPRRSRQRSTRPAARPTRVR